MRIAICDDDPYFRDIIIKYIESFLNGNNKHVLKEFKCGEDLLFSYNSANIYDVLFLDIEMKEMNGIDAAQAIRKIDRDIIIVFLTSHKEYIFQSLQIEIFDYLIKPINQTEFDCLFERFLEKYQRQHFIIEIKQKKYLTGLAVNEIICIESRRRHLVFHTEKKNYECIGKLSDSLSTLSNYGFIQCHKEILINLNYVLTINEWNITTTLNTTVDMSVRKRQECLSAFNRYLARRRL